MNLTGKRTGFIILAAIIPITYIVNPVVFVLTIVISGILLIKDVNGNYNNKFLVIFLYMTLFSGVTVLGFRLYDIVIIAAFIYNLLKTGSNNLPLRALPFFAIVVIELILHFSADSATEAIRYLICILLLFYIINSSYCVNNIRHEIFLITVFGLYFVLIVFALMQLNLISNYASPFINTNLFIYTAEIRLNGFFSDPNKYMSYCFAVLFIVDAYIEKSKGKTILILLILISSIVSLSRTALIVVFAYIVLKIANNTKGSISIIYRSLILLSLVVIFILMLNSNIITDIGNSLYQTSSNLMGRERQLQLSSTLEGDNRTIIWKASLDLIKDRIILGYGLMSNEWLLPYPTHNTILALLLDGGLFLLFSYLLMFLPLYKCKRWDIVIACIVIPSLMLDLQNYRMFFLILGFVINPYYKNLAENTGI